jgi:hypothetical protein
VEAESHSHMTLLKGCRNCSLKIADRFGPIESIAAIMWRSSRTWAMPRYQLRRQPGVQFTSFLRVTTALCQQAAAMPKLARPYRFSGRIGPTDVLHRAIKADTGIPHLDFNGELADFVLPGTVIPPTYVDIPGGYKVPQYAPTVVGGPSRYDPPGDCNGDFMTSKFKPNNNCYNYACNIATNSFAQPGRMHGILLSGSYSGQSVLDGAKADGLVMIGKKELKPSQLPPKAPSNMQGHFVALLISDPDTTIGWPGDYHWVRCDDSASCGNWSQKDGSDEMTNFDCGGSPIVDPSTANWSVNQGHVLQSSPGDVVIAYEFFAWLFVPAGAVTII